MTEQALTRLAELQREYEVGQRRLQEVVAQEVVDPRDAAADQRGDPGPDGADRAVRAFGGDSPGAVARRVGGRVGPAQDAEPAAPGTVLRVG